MDSTVTIQKRKVSPVTRQLPGDIHSLSNNYIISILQDREGVLWFGTFGAGINKLNTGWMNFAHYQYDANNPNSLSDNMVRAFFEENDNALWIGTLERGVDRFDRENDIWRNFPYNPDDPSSLSDSFVSAIYEDHSGALWIGTASGLDRYEPDTETFTHFQADSDTPPVHSATTSGLLLRVQRASSGSALKRAYIDLTAIRKAGVIIIITTLAIL